jgi:hypothetical protein
MCKNVFEYVYLGKSSRFLQKLLRKKYSYFVQIQMCNYRKQIIIVSFKIIYLGIMN